MFIFLNTDWNEFQHFIWRGGRHNTILLMEAEARVQRVPDPDIYQGSTNYWMSRNQGSRR